MPNKGNKKRPSKGGPNSQNQSKKFLEPVLTSDDGDSNIDNVSVVSLGSSKLDIGSDDGIPGNCENQEDDGFYDDFEDKLLEAIEGTSEKSVKTRQMCLEAIKKAFTKRYCVDFIVERKITLTDMLERCLKRGKGEEQGSAAILAAVVCVSLGPGDDVDKLFRDIESHLIVAMNDASIQFSTRAKCAISLGLCCFIAGNGGESIDAIMDFLFGIFKGSFLKGDGSVPNLPPQASALHSSALLAWTLLLTIQSSTTVLRLAEAHMNRLAELLESPDVELRIAAGETIAVLHEISREVDEDFEINDMDILCDKLRLLATDSQKFRAKKERRVQRSSFRDVLKCVEERDVPNDVVKFGRERLFIDSWCRKRQYDAFCQVLGSGMNLHLSENDLLREIFELGQPLSNATGYLNKISKFERHMENIAASKARTKSRGKLRDKRADIV